MKIPVGVSNRHVHLSKEDFEKLFEDKELTVYRQINQPGQFAATQKVKLVGPNGEIDNVRVVGPLRKNTQIELLHKDQNILGLTLLRKVSGDIENTSGLTIVGVKGKIRVNKGAILALMHIHLSKSEAEEINVKDGDKLKIKYKGKFLFENILARCGDGHKAEFHLDIDEAEEAGLKNGDLVEISK